MKPGTLLFRQIHPVFVLGSSVSEQAFMAIDKQAFTPSTKDEGMLSVYSDIYFTPQSSFEHYTQSLISAGTLGVTVDECTRQNLHCIDDNVPFEGHCSIDFRHQAKPQKRISAVGLRDRATERGWLYRP